LMAIAAASLLVASGWAGAGLMGSAGAETSASATRGATATTYHRGNLARGSGDVKVQALSISAEDSTFHPLEPCRIVDTSRTEAGSLYANEERDFLAISPLGGFGDQGGSEADCGVPDTATAIHVNVAAKNPLAKGNLRVFPYGVALPTASFVNYSRSVNVANAGTVKLCRTAVDLGLCAYDFTIYSSAVTDVVVDVMGYYEGPMTVRVSSTGVAAAASLSVLNVAKGWNAGEYKVTFDRDIVSCVYMATPDPHAINVETGEVSVALWAIDEPDSVYVHTANSDGTWADHAFSLVVHC